MIQQSMRSISIPDQAVAYVTNRWSTQVVQPVLIAAMITAVYAAGATLFAISNQNVVWSRSILLAFLVVLEGVMTTVWLYKPDQRSNSKLAYRAAEAVVLFLLVRLGLWVIGDARPQVELFTEYLRYPGQLAQGMFLPAYFMMMVAWTFGLSVSELFRKLAISEAEAYYYLTPKKQRLDDERPFQLNRLALIQIFYNQWLALGMLLVVLTALSTFDVPTAFQEFTLNVTRLGLKPQMLSALIIFFLGGFLLISQGRLTARSARWLREGTSKSVELEKGWYRYSQWVLLIVILIAAVLPIWSTDGIGSILGQVLRAIFNVITALLFLIIGFFRSLFPPAEAGETLQPTPEPVARPTAAPVEPIPPSEPSEVFGYFISSTVWALIIVFSIIAITYFLRERGIRLNRAFFQQIWQQLRWLLRSTWRGVSTQANQLQRAVRQRLQNNPQPEKPPTTPPWQFIRVNGLPPREQIKYFYLSTLQRADEKGIGRQENMTPAEFAAMLKEQFPDAEEEVDVLTEAFMRARYTAQIIERDESNTIKARWKRMRSNIRKRRS